MVSHPILRSFLIDCVVLQWDHGRINGFGTLLYTDGDRCVFVSFFIEFLTALCPSVGCCPDSGTSLKNFICFARGVSPRRRYIGNWVDGKMHGQGTYVYADGDKYEGEWKDDKRHGRGTVTYRGQDGSVVEKFEVRAHQLLFVVVLLVECLRSVMVLTH